MTPQQLRALGSALAKQALAESKKITEEAEETIEVREASEVWEENKDSVQVFVPTTVYLVRPIDGGAKFEVEVEEGATKKAFGTLDRIELDKTFTPTQPKQTPDAEGYTIYRKLEELEAVEYTGDTVRVNLDGSTTALLKKGDFLVRTADGENFKYEIKDAKTFDIGYKAR